MTDGKMRGGGRGRIDALRGWTKVHPEGGRRRDLLQDHRRLNPEPPVTPDRRERGRR